jgi:hypothetical protein
MVPFQSNEEVSVQDKNTLKSYDDLSLKQAISTVMNPANDLCRDIYLVLFN